MNPHRYLLLLVLPAIFLFSAAAPGTSASDEYVPGLELSCILLHHGDRLSQYTIIAYRDDAHTDTLHVSKSKTVFFRLDYNHQYAIIHKAEGFRDRVIMVNTKVNTRVAKTDEVFDYELEMLDASEPINTLYDLPVALVRYDARLQKFDYSKKYNDQVREKTQTVAGK